MKNVLLLLSFFVLSLPAAWAQAESYGEKITEDGAKPVSKLPSLMKGKKELKLKVSGPVLMACQKKGCWMKVDLGKGESMRVTFKEYAFFVPKNSGGKTAIMQGTASWQETSVEELKHYAKDAGKPQAEIDAIKKPLRELVFEADGVILK